MNNRLEGYIRFFEDQIRESELEYLSYLSAPMNELFQVDRAFIGEIVGYIEDKGHIIVRMKRNHTPRMKIKRTFCVLRDCAWQELGTPPAKWDIICKTFLSSPKYHTDFSDIKPLYYLQNDDTQHDYIGCSAVDVELYDNIVRVLKEGKKKLWIVMVDGFPPIQYLKNLINYIETNQDDPNLLITPKLDYDHWHPTELTNKDDRAAEIIKVLKEEEICILQGPPGTGKSYTIAQIVNEYLDNGKTVCVTTMSNKGLTELLEKSFLETARKEGRVYKTLLTADELTRIPGTKKAKKDCIIGNGELLCVTNYILSHHFSTKETRQLNPIYDLVVIEEASQAFLTAIAAFSRLGQHCLIVGDPMQLPPIVLREDKQEYIEYDVPTQANGLRTCVLGSSIKCFRITTSYRLSSRSALLTGVFYNNSLTSVQETPVIYSSPQLSHFYPNHGGTILYTTQGATDAICSSEALKIMKTIVSDFELNYATRKIAIISPFKDSVKRLQREFYHERQKLEITVETIDRIQGITVDYSIVYIPPANYKFALSENRFNVATSRSSSTTLIISDTPIEGFSTTSPKVASYLKACSILNRDYSITPRSLEIPTQVKDVTTTPLISLKVVGKIDLSPFERPKKEIKSDKKNYFIIDTNVFVNCPDIISKIDKKYPIILSAKVTDELDKMKIKLDERGKQNAEKALRLLNNESSREIIYEFADTSLLPDDFDKRSPDNMILSVALKYKDENPIMLTSDNGLQLKSKILKISTISLKNFLKR